MSDARDRVAYSASFSAAGFDPPDKMDANRRGYSCTAERGFLTRSCDDLLNRSRRFRTPYAYLLGSALRWSRHLLGRSRIR